MTGAVSSETWDEVIVGAGSAGAVLAARLSECPDRRVLLLEAGGIADDPADPSRPPDMPVLSGHNWDFSAHVGPDSAAGRHYPYLLGKVLGGSSAVNGAIALRGLPSDFDGWAAAGNPEWAWERVLPCFMRLETDRDFTGEGHGGGGPLPIGRSPTGEFGPMASAFLRSCVALGMPELPDLNGGAGVGVGAIPRNTSGTRRISTADAYLAQAWRRANLEIRPRSHVTKVLLDGTRAVGVEVLHDGRLSAISAGNVTLSAGAVNSPAILQRSGIGDATRLKELGIDPACDVPGVGENLADHPTIALWGVPEPGACRAGEPLHQVMARVASEGGVPDLNVTLASNVAAAEIPMVGRLLRGGRPVVSIAAMLLTPVSRGSVRLRSADPQAGPAIRLPLAAAPRDVDRLVHGLRLVNSVVRQPAVANLLQRILLWTDRMMEDEVFLRGAVAKFASPSWHPAGTARMGPSTDGMAVVDQYCRVHTADNLRVVDASAMSSIPSAPTNLTCIMLAERVAEWMA